MVVDKSTSGGGDPPNAEMTITVPVPVKDSHLFRYEATDRIVQFLADNPHTSCTIRELGRLTDYSHPAVKNAVDVLAANDLVRVEPKGNSKQVTINRSRLTKPDDDVLRIPQSSFHAPVRSAVERLRETLDDVEGIVVFGSVARGDADRRSDVDLWVLVRGDRGTNQRRANEMATELADERFDGDRYEFQILVESVRSALNVGDRLEEALSSGITVYDTETLRRVKRSVIGDVE